MSARWLEKYCGDQREMVARIISQVNERTNFLRLLHEGVKNNTLISPYKYHVNTMIQDDYLFWKEIVRQELRGKVADVMIGYVRQRFNNYFFS